MIIVADSSALIALAICDGLHLLEQIFEKVVVPKAVFIECSVSTKPQATTLNRFLKEKVENINPADYLQLPANLGQEEIEAMILYKKLNAHYLLIDDKRARKIATLNDIKIIGSLGMLLVAKKKGYVNEITPFLNKLKHSELYISKALLKKVKHLADE